MAFKPKSKTGVKRKDDKGRGMFKRRKFCRFTAEKIAEIDYKDVEILKDFVAENAKIKYMVPKEGSDLWVDTMVITKASKNPDAAAKFIDFVLKADNGKWVVENIMYKTPNKAGMEAIDQSMLTTYPNMAITPADLLKYEQLRDLGDGMKAFSKTVSEIMAAK